MPDAQLDDVRLNYRIDGPADAPALLLSNSLGTDLSMWDAQVAAFSQRYRVVRYDTRGHGRSEVTPGPYTMEQLGQDVVGLLDTLGIERADFCGVSMGGQTGMVLAARHAARFGRFVLANTAAWFSGTDAWNARIARVQAEAMGAVAGAMMDRWFTPEFQAAHPEALARVRDVFARTDPRGYCANCAAVRDSDRRADLDRIAAPVLVIAGARDPVSPPADGHAIARAVPDARCVELDAAHLSNLEQPEAFARTVLDFFQEPHHERR
jgi:3-oxoadipate enol-lactonase